MNEPIRQLLATTEPSETILMAQGEFSPSPRLRTRHLFLALSGDGPPRFLADAWIETTRVDPCRTHIRKHRKLRIGGCDAMYATAMTWAWCTDEADPFEIWNAEGLLLRLASDHLLLRETPDTPIQIPRSDIHHVAGELSDDWVRRAVSLHLKDGKTLDVALLREVAAQLDPTYDKWDVMFDASWVRSMATALAKALGVKLTLAEDL